MILLLNIYFTNKPISLGLPIFLVGSFFSNSDKFFTNSFTLFVLNGPGAIFIIDTPLDEKVLLNDFNTLLKPNLNEAKQRYYQEWDVWLAAGYLDKAMIMNYSPDLKVFSNNINILFRNLPLKYRNKIVMGLATYNQTSDQVVNKIKYSYQT